jgi:hypothetical protein
MILFLLFVLLPLTAEAQTTFGPLRLDDSLAQTFYYPNLVSVGDTALRCMWSSQTDATVKVESRMLTVNGAPLGPRVLLDSADGQFTCPAFLSLLPLNSGGDARLICHS